jgi:hypothetical protein
MLRVSRTAIVNMVSAIEKQVDDEQAAAQQAVVLRR